MAYITTALSLFTMKASQGGNSCAMLSIHTFIQVYESVALFHIFLKAGFYKERGLGPEGVEKLQA